MTRSVSIDRSIAMPARMFLDMETRRGMNVAVSYVFILDGTLSADDVRAAVEELKAVTPRLRQRIALDASGREMWCPTDAEGQLDFVDLPPGSDPTVVFDQCSRLQERVFPLDRPLWQVVSYSGIRGGRSALLVRLHHAVGNGAEVLAMLASAFGVDAKGTVWVDAPQQASASVGGEAEPGGISFNSRRQHVSVLHLGTRRVWDTVTARYGVSSDVLSVSLLADAMLRYWQRTGTTRDAVVATMPTTSEKLHELSNGAMGLHVPNVAVSADLVGVDRLDALSTLLAAELAASEQKSMETMYASGMSAPAGDPAGPPGVAMTDLLVTSFVTMPVMAVRGCRVVDFSGFAPVTGTHVVASPIDYDGQVGLCVNVDTSLVSPEVFGDCAREVVATILGGHPTATTG